MGLTPRRDRKQAFGLLLGGSSKLPRPFFWKSSGFLRLLNNHS
jgi:hypothetical protein